MPSEALKGMTTQEVFDLLQFQADQQSEMKTLIDDANGDK
jgi:hypothetical protein